MHSEQDRLIALAGIFQAAWLTHQVAYKGMADSRAMEASIHSLFQIDAESVPAVFGGMPGVAGGLRYLSDQLSAPSRRGSDISRYVIALMHLERKLSADPTMLAKLGQDIQRIGARLEHFSLLHNNILTQLADCYAQTISTLQPRIMVNGEPAHLQNPDNANKIRALLLAGIRSALLWRQCGGTRLQILLRQRRLKALAQTLLSELQTDPANPA